jgi:hypothetical protein
MRLFSSFSDGPHGGFTIRVPPEYVTVDVKLGGSPGLLPGLSTAEQRNVWQDDRRCAGYFSRGPLRDPGRLARQFFS